MQRDTWILLFQFGKSYHHEACFVHRSTITCLARLVPENYITVSLFVFCLFSTLKGWRHWIHRKLGTEVYIFGNRTHFCREKRQSLTNYWSKNRTSNWFLCAYYLRVKEKFNHVIQASNLSLCSLDGAGLQIKYWELSLYSLAFHLHTVICSGCLLKALFIGLIGSILQILHKQS